MTPLIYAAILIAATLASFALAFVLTRLGLTAIFRLLTAVRPPLRVISGGRTRARVGASLSTPTVPA
jgi:hypothetical protein